MHRHTFAEEWPTWAMLAATYAAFGLGTTWLWGLSPVLAVAVVAVAVAQFMSLQHEALHGHPFANPHLNHALVFPALGLIYPYLRFQDTHLAHHHDPILTDPYDDPESNFLDPAVWARLGRATQGMLRLNNTLFGRMVLGPVIGAITFVGADLRAMLRGDRRILMSYALHLCGVGMVLAWLMVWGAMPVWAWALAVYLGMAVLKVRTYLEHRAHEAHRARTVIIEDRGPLALLFLNNNLHVVHHMHPAVPWHRLPGMYRANAEHYRRRNDGYVYRSYAEVFRRYFLRAKDPVPHPIWPVAKAEPEERAAAE